jgi:hypothetical protein
MAMKLQLDSVKQALPLDAATPHMNSFVNLMHGRQHDNPVDAKKYDALHPAFETIFKAVVQYQGEDDVKNKFKGIVTKIATEMGEQTSVSGYLAKKDIVPISEVNDEIADRNFGFLDVEAGYEVDGVIVGIQVGNHFRTIRVGSELHTSTLKTIKESLAGRYHVLINFQAPESAPAKKANKLWLLTLPFTFVWNVIKFPFATKTRTVLTVSIIVGVASVYFAAGGVPSTDTLCSWGATAKSYTWDYLPTWDETTKFASDLKTKWVG